MTCDTNVCFGIYGKQIKATQQHDHTMIRESEQCLSCVVSDLNVKFDNVTSSSEYDIEHRTRTAHIVFSARTMCGLNVTFTAVRFQAIAMSDAKNDVNQSKCRGHQTIIPERVKNADDFPMRPLSTSMC